MLADRFRGTSPFLYQHVGAQQRAHLLAMLNVEAEVSRAYEGVDEVVFIDD